MPEQLICKNMELGYEGMTVAQGISFTINEGDYVCILGENGSGKSTLVKAILGLISPLGGEMIRTGGVKKNEIGYLPQQTVVQKDFPASVKEIVLSGFISKAGLRPFYTKAEKELARKTMERLDIIGLEKRCYRELSGGQQQRVLLARALCAAGRMLLLDEPVTGLDPKAQAELYELVSGLNKEGVTIIMVSHDVAASVKYASHILHIGEKKQLFFGKTEDYLQSSTGKLFMETEAAQ